MKFKNNHIVSILNQKGGVGKTTTCINLATGLSMKNYKVLCVDLDPQANLTTSCGLDPDDDITMMNLLSGGIPQEVIKTRDHFDIIPASIALSEFDVNYSSKMRRENLIKKQLEPLEDKYDIILMDCSPSLGLITVNSLVASSSLLIPQQTEFLSMRGMELIFHTVEMIRENKLNNNLKILGILQTMYDQRKRLHKEVKETILQEFNDLVFKTTIRSNADLATAPSHYKSIFEYNEQSNGAKDYTAFIKEFIKRLRQEEQSHES